MARVVAEEAIRTAIREMHEWHPKTPLLLVFSKQRPGEGGTVSASTGAVRNVYNPLFNLNKIGVEDPSNKFYLHCCQNGKKDHCERRLTDAYGKGHQRTISDTLAKDSYFLDKLESSQYRLESDFQSKVFDYLGIDERLDLKPLVLFHYWNDLRDQDTTIKDLWNRFSETFETREPPFDQIFDCTDLDEEIPTQNTDEEAYSIRRICLPQEFGAEHIDSSFWKTFRSELGDCLEDVDWQGEKSELISFITGGLMRDQSIFLLGPSGTGKTTLVRKAIVPALRRAYGVDNELRFEDFTITPETTQASLFGFQGLDGSWVAGPLTEKLLLPVESADGEESVDLNVPVLVFFDEANRVDIEGLLSPIQSALDRLQQREDAGEITLGSDAFTLPKRVWRVYAGNSPATDLGRVNQSRPFKRRTSVVIPPDYARSVLGDSEEFKSVALSLLEKKSDVDDPEVREPALDLLGLWRDNPDRLEEIRNILIEINKLPRVSVTVGVVEA